MFMLFHRSNGKYTHKLISISKYTLAPWHLDIPWVKLMCVKSTRYLREMGMHSFNSSDEISMQIQFCQAKWKRTKIKSLFCAACDCV